MPIKVPSMGGFSVGAATMSVTFTDDQATATATSASVGLGAKNVFHVDTCVKAHALKKTYDVQCNQKTVDTTSNAASITVQAPVATETLSRPASGDSAYFSYLVQVSTRQADGKFKAMASSWPSGGLSGASVGVPAVGAITAPAPVREGAAMSDASTGGINTGKPDSMCESTPQGPDPAPPGDGVSTTALGTDAPAYYEAGEPSGSYAGQTPKGVMLIIHGGGWFVAGPSAVAAVRSDADRWRARGWRTLNVDYRACTAPVNDLLWFYDRARSQWGSTLPYCAMGGSAGGTLALTLAWARPTLACADVEAGITDAVVLPGQKTPKGGSDGPRWAYNLLTAAVGPEKVAWYSPAGFKIRARVLFGVAADDPYIPWAQATELQSKMQANYPDAYVDLYQLPAGTAPWMHASVTPDSIQAFYDREQQLVAPLTPTSQP